MGSPSQPGTRDHDAVSSLSAPRPTILIVDDERGIVESLGKIFEREGIHALVAFDGPGAIDLLRKHRVSVLLTDLMMPGMSGLDLLKATRAMAPETEVVL